MATDWRTALDQASAAHRAPMNANVLAVQIAGVRLIHAGMPREVRAALNAAVKAGELGHLKKDGVKPEAFFHKNSRARAIEQRNAVANASIRALSKVCI